MGVIQVEDQRQIESVKGDQQEDTGKHANKDDGLKGDHCNILLLVLLYFLQGVPIGMVEAIPLILKSKNLSYDYIALFSLTHWPLSLKILWAPIVDSFYSTRFGQRKSWFVPVQYAIGVLMVLLSFQADLSVIDVRMNEDKLLSKVVLITVGFLSLVFLVACQDIAVDGWGLTILSKRNVIYAPSCNSVGLILGLSCGNTLFLALQSPVFCNQWLRVTPSQNGIVTFGGFLQFWGAVYIVVTTLVMIFKRETESDGEESKGVKMGVIQTYKIVWHILGLSTVRWYVLILLTNKIALAPIYTVGELKLVQHGFRPENIGIIKMLMLPLQVALPWAITKHFGRKPMQAFSCFYLVGLSILLPYAGVIWWTSDPSSKVSPYFHINAASIICSSVIITNCAVSSMRAFTAKIADPRIGGTYMTLIATVAHLGHSFTITFSMYFVGLLNFEWCPNDGFIFRAGGHNTTSFTSVAGHFYVDGYFVESCICLTIGIIWFAIFAKIFKWLDASPLAMWRCF